MENKINITKHLMRIFVGLALMGHCSGLVKSFKCSGRVLQETKQEDLIEEINKKIGNSLFIKIELDNRGDVSISWQFTHTNTRFKLTYCPILDVESLQDSHLDFLLRTCTVLLQKPDRDVSGFSIDPRVLNKIKMLLLQKGKIGPAATK